MSMPPVGTGDIFLLFLKFPFFGLETDLPIQVGPAVFLDSIPHNVLDRVSRQGVADFVQPGYSLGHGSNCCLRRPASAALAGGMSASNALFLAAVALRMVAPFGIEIAGEFELTAEGDRIGSPKLYLVRSPWHPGSRSEHRYSGGMIERASQIAHRIVALKDAKRLMSAYVLFSQVTLGMTSSLQMATMALFSALEALFVPRGDHARALANWTANFFSPLAFPVAIAGWLECEYISRRSKLDHGVQDILPWGPVEPEKLAAFRRLHELVRLAILGFLCLPEEDLQAHSTLRVAMPSASLIHQACAWGLS